MPALRTRDTQSRPLEVTTDAPQPPALAIISPTPRAFTFPVAHNLADSPYSTPSNSPFEPDLRSLAINSSSSCTTPPPLMRTLSPDTSITSVSPSPSSHKRRKSTSSDVERRPKKGDEDYIKRPENAFILFRRKCCEDRQQAEEEAAANGPTKKQRQADLSKTISQQWKGLSPEERQYWEELAKEKKKEHQRAHPGYVYRPQRVRDKDGKARNKKRRGKGGELAEHEVDVESMSYVLPPPRHHGRSASAPTPPPMSYQSIQIPNMYMTPSCPTSPSLLPMISRRSSSSGNPEDTMSNFDYLPSEHLMPHSFGQAGYEASLQSSEFLRSMFNMSSQAESASGNAPQLQPLTLSTDPSMLLPAHQIVSPLLSPIGSGSSGPSSPATGPFTPTSSMVSHPSYSQLNIPSSGCMPEPQTQAELDLQMEMQLSHDIDYSSYSWDTNTVWQTESSMIMGNDFDMSAIPPIELGMPKYSHEPSYVSSSEQGVSEYGQEYQQEYAPAEYGQEYVSIENVQYADGSQNIEGLLGFDEMMAQAGRSF